jgi:serine/threonine protein kinase
MSQKVQFLSTEKEQKDFARERALLSSLNSEYIVRAIDGQFDRCGTIGWFCMELCSGGSLGRVKPGQMVPEFDEVSPVPTVYSAIISYIICFDSQISPHFEISAG